MGSEFETADRLLSLGLTNQGSVSDKDGVSQFRNASYVPAYASPLRAGFCISRLGFISSPLILLAFVRESLRKRRAIRNQEHTEIFHNLEVLFAIDACVVTQKQPRISASGS